MIWKELGVQMLDVPKNRHGFGNELFMQSFMEIWELAADFGLGFQPFRLDAKWVPLGLQHYLKCARTMALHWGFDFDFWAEFGPTSVEKSIDQYGWSADQLQFWRQFPHHQAQHRKLFGLLHQHQLLEVFFSSHNDLQAAMGAWTNNAVDASIKVGKRSDRDANNNTFEIKLGVVFARLDEWFSSKAEVSNLEQVFWCLCLLVGRVNFEQYMAFLRDLEDERERDVAASFFVFYKCCTDVKFKDQSATKPVRAEEVFDMDYSLVPSSQRPLFRFVFSKLAGLRGTAQLRRAQFFPKTMAVLDAFLLEHGRTDAASLSGPFLLTGTLERGYPAQQVTQLKRKFAYPSQGGAS
jgi:hypothetical protein